MIKKIFCAIILIVFSVSCKKDDSENDIPNVLVDLNVSISSNSSLNAVSGWAYVSGGSRGIVIYRHTLDEFFAMERHCPYLPANGAQVSVDSSGIFLKDLGCGSKFYMTDGGSVANGPATRPLKRYNATYDGVNTIHVYN